MNSFVGTADRGTHLKIVMLALAAGALFVSIAMITQPARLSALPMPPRMEVPNTVPSAPEAPPMKSGRLVAV
jgi:hypothetical protein